MSKDSNSDNTPVNSNSGKVPAKPFTNEEAKMLMDLIRNLEEQNRELRQKNQELVEHKNDLIKNYNHNYQVAEHAAAVSKVDLNQVISKVAAKYNDFEATSIDSDDDVMVSGDSNYSSDSDSESM